MKSILGIGNALTDILAVLPDETLLKTYHLPKGSMQHVDMETGDKIWQALKPLGVKYVAGGSAANTITCTSIFGMPYSFIGKIGEDELGLLFQERPGAVWSKFDASEERAFQRKKYGFRERR